VGGPNTVFTFTNGLTEVDPGFWTVTLAARDQNGADVDDAEIYLRRVREQYFAPGTAVTVPKGCSVKVHGIVPNLSGPNTVVTFTDGLAEVDPGFRTVGVRCRAEDGAIAPDGTAYLKNLGIQHFPDGVTVTVPGGDTVSTKSRRVNLYANVYDNTVFDDALDPFEAKFMWVFFRANDVNGDPIPDAEIDLYGSGLARFPNESSQILPYPDTVRVRVYKDGQLIADVRDVVVDSEVVVPKPEKGVTAREVPESVISLATQWDPVLGLAGDAPSDTGMTVLLDEDFSGELAAGWTVRAGTGVTCSGETGVLVIEDTAVDETPLEDDSQDGEGLAAADAAVPEEALIVCSEGAEWSEYGVSVSVRSEGEGEIGVLLRYTGEDNHVKFSWDVATGVCTATQCEAGVATVLGKTLVPCEIGRTYDIEVSLVDGRFTVSVDGVEVLSSSDVIIGAGTVALCSKGVDVMLFDDVRVGVPAAGDDAEADSGPDPGGGGSGGGCFVRTAQ
jgi:hypothetical protein